MTKRISSFGGALAMAATVACASGRPSAITPLAGKDSLVVQVWNQNFADATIYLLYEGRIRDRLGIVTGNQRQVFQIPWYTEQLHFQVDLIGGDLFASDLLTVVPGDIIELQLPANLANSGFFRRISR